MSAQIGQVTVEVDRFGKSLDEQAGPVVISNVKVVTKRTASFKIPFEPEHPLVTLVGKVNVGAVVLERSDRRYNLELPKTLTAIDALAALLEAVRAELVEQGVES